MTNSTNALRCMTCELLGWALCDLFPGAQLIKNHVDDVTFSFEVALQQYVDEEMLPFIEERMRILLKQDIKIRKLEMVRNNAAAYLQHRNQHLLAQTVGHCKDALVSLIELGDQFVDICPASLLHELPRSLAFKLLSIMQIKMEIPKQFPQHVMRISGTVFSDTSKLKQFLKKYKEVQQFPSDRIGQDMKLFSFIENTPYCLWLPKGSLLRQLIRDFTSFSKNKIELPHPLEDPLSKIYSALQNSQLPTRFQTYTHQEGLFGSPSSEQDLFLTHCSSNQATQEVTSSLQFIDKIIKIFGFQHRWILYQGRPIPSQRRNWEARMHFLTDALKGCALDYVLDQQEKTLYGPKVEMRLTDAIGREWPSAYVAIDCRTAIDKPLWIRGSILGSLDRFVALVLEHYKGMLPLWLAPEQARVIAIKKEQEAYASTIDCALQNAGWRSTLDRGEGSLDTRVHAAEQERVPYVVIVGNREEQRQEISVRAFDKSHCEKLTTVRALLALLDEERKQ